MNENTYNDEIEIDLVELVIYLIKKLKNIILITLACVVLSVGYTYFIGYNNLQKENAVNQASIDEHMAAYQATLDKAKETAQENLNHSRNLVDISLNKHDYFSKANILISPTETNNINNAEFINNICNTFSYLSSDHQLLKEVLTAEEFADVDFDNVVDEFSVYTVANSSLIAVRKLYDEGDNVDVYNTVVAVFAQALADEINDIYGENTASVQSTPEKQNYVVYYSADNKKALAEYEKNYNTAVSNAQNTYNTETTKYMTTAPKIDNTSATSMIIKSSLVTGVLVGFLCVLYYFIVFAFGDSLISSKNRVIESLKQK